ncbi:MAG: MmcQ/YjbR family DNA-binding protein [Vulcanimicrobiaceae bacterium]
MASWRDVRRIALALPGTSERATSGGTATWDVKEKGFVWERPLRKQDHAALGASAPTGAILGVRTPDLEMKEALLARDPSIYFTTPHFDGYPAVLVRLGAISVAELRDVIVEAWLARAPQRLVTAFLAKSKPAK